MTGKQSISEICTLEGHPAPELIPPPGAKTALYWGDSPRILRFTCESPEKAIETAQAITRELVRYRLDRDVEATRQDNVLMFVFGVTGGKLPRRWLPMIEPPEPCALPLGIKFRTADVDRTTDFVDELEIPWYGSPLSESNAGAMTPGRITSFLFWTAPDDGSSWADQSFMVSWHDRATPTQAELLLLYQDYIADDEDDDTATDKDTP